MSAARANQQATPPNHPSPTLLLEIHGTIHSKARAGLTRDISRYIISPFLMLAHSTPPYSLLKQTRLLIKSTQELAGLGGDAAFFKTESDTRYSRALWGGHVRSSPSLVLPCMLINLIGWVGHGRRSPSPPAQDSSTHSSAVRPYLTTGFNSAGRLV